MPRGSKPGERRGGRAKGVSNKATREVKQSLEILAQGHADAALQALVAVATAGESEAARVSAAVAILDRGFGRPRQAVEHTGKDGQEAIVHKLIADFSGADD